MSSLVTEALHFFQEATKASSNARMLCTGRLGELLEVLGPTAAVQTVGGWIAGQ